VDLGTRRDLKPIPVNRKEKARSEKAECSGNFQNQFARRRVNKRQTGGGAVVGRNVSEGF